MREIAPPTKHCHGQLLRPRARRGLDALHDLFRGRNRRTSRSGDESVFGGEDEAVEMAWVDRHLPRGELGQGHEVHYRDQGSRFGRRVATRQVRT